MTQTSNQTVLIAEDDALNRLYLKTVLRQNGYSIVEAKTGNDAVRLAKEIAPHIILMDLTMPGMNGIEAATEIRKQPNTAAVPIIAITAYETDDFGAASEEAGMNGFITKPVSEEDLLQTIRDSLR